LSFAVAAHAQFLNTHHVRDDVRSGRAQFVSRMPASQTLQLNLVLNLRDPEGLKSFLSDLYNPASPNYRHFITPQQFTARFGPTQDQYDAVLRFAKNYGLEVVGGSRDGMDVEVKGTVATIETALHVSMRVYQHPTENRTFFAPDAEPVVDLPFNLWHISGLDNYSNPHPLYSKKSDVAAARGIDAEKLVTHATTGSGPSASFLGSDMRAAYYGGTALTGAGQNLGLFEYLGTDLADLTTYFKNTGQTNKVPVTVLSTDGTSTSCVDTRAGGRCDDTEQTLDMTQAIGMAPGLASLVMYVGSTDTAIISAMTTHSPLPTTIGCSWGWTPADPKTLDPYFEKMAAQGQNFFAASGDSSTWSTRNEAWPADDAYVVSVGGTDLVTASAAGPWKSETAWTDSGGGISPDKVAIPAWQKLSGVITSTNKGSTTYRNGPDVSANANFTFYVCADQTTCTANDYGGTSFAAPMWAAYIALVNQQRAASGKTTIGFINPDIYAENVTAATYAADFHDISSGKSGSYSAVTGYDLVTGWGSPTPTLITELAAQ
jgi:kumamolisin